ncbi:MAG TPA: DUF5675 family protein [Acidobacteriota bacterium]|nr:DUF5675 family protein [Acidobacteriota bacterium]
MSRSFFFTSSVTPVLAGYGFIPSNAVVALSGADQAIATPFDGTVLTYCIFGQVTDDKGTGVEGVSVNLDPVDPTPHMSTLTDSSGNYQFCDLANGRYWVTCKGGGHYFWTIVVNNADRYGIDFQLESPTESREESSGQGLIERKNAKAVKSKAGDNRLQSNTETSAFSPQPSALASGTPESTGAVRYYIWDHLGTTRVVTDGNGALISTHDYEPFGVEIPPFGDTGNVTDLPSPNSHKFTGHERDQSTGYDYMHARFYGSSIGRFMRPDPVGGNPANPQSWNLYAYVENNPVNRIDPTGLTDIVIEIERQFETARGATMGAYSVAGTDISGFTLERAECVEPMSNSRIPAGEYSGRIDNSPSRGYDVIWVDGDPKNRPIQMHPGNTIKDTTGCILPGVSASNDAVTQSRVAFDELMDYCNQVITTDRAAGDTTTITIKISDPSTISDGASQNDGESEAKLPVPDPCPEGPTVSDDQ